MITWIGSSAGAAQAAQQAEPDTMVVTTRGALPEAMSPVMETLSRPIFHIGDDAVTLVSFITFAVILLLAYAASLALQRSLRRLYVSRGVAEGMRYALDRLLHYGILAIGVFVALQNLGIEMGALAALGAVIGVGIGFGLQQIAQNFVSGIILLIERPVKRGDFVEVGETRGIVREIRARATIVTTRDNIDILVPNGQFITEPVINQTFETRVIRGEVAVGVAYGSDTRLVQSTLEEAAGRHPRVLEEPPPQVRFDAFGDSSLDFTLLFWIADPLERLDIASDLRYEIDADFRARGIEIPFPQRDLHVRSGLAPAAPG